MPHTHRPMPDADSLAAVMAMAPEDRLRLVMAEKDALAAALASLEERMPTAEDLAYLRQRREQDERATWALQVIKKNAPWLVALFGMLGSALYWLLTHNVSITPKP